MKKVLGLVLVLVLILGLTKLAVSDDSKPIKRYNEDISKAIERWVEDQNDTYDNYIAEVKECATEHEKKYVAKETGKRNEILWKELGRCLMKAKAQNNEESDINWDTFVARKDGVDQVLKEKAGKEKGTNADKELE